MTAGKAARKWVLCGLLLFLAVTPGCYGTFNLTRNLYQWNADVSENRWAVEGAFVGLVIVPCYPFAMLGDAIVFNSVEFWTGDNPVDPPTGL